MGGQWLPEPGLRTMAGNSKARKKDKYRKMKNGFVKLIRSKETERLLKDDPNSFLLLTVIALRANWHDDFNTQGLQQGEALIGDYPNYGLTRQEYRGASLRLRKWQFVTFRATTKGTIARLSDKRVYDINAPTKQPTEQPSSNHQATTNEEYKKLRSLKKERAQLKVPTALEVTEYAKTIDFPLDGNTFVDYYAARGWKVKGGQSMKDWKAAVRNWRNRRKESENGKSRNHRADNEFEIPAEYADAAITT